MRYFSKLIISGLLAATAFAGQANAAIVVDKSVDAIGLQPGFTASNSSPGQNFLVQFTLSQNTNLDGADIYSDFANGNLLGTSTIAKFRLDNAGAPGAIDVLNFATNINAVDTNGSSSNPSIKRLHVDFGALNFGPGTYWFGLTGNNNQIGLNLEFGAPGSAGLWQLQGNALQFSFGNQTKAAFRLYGTSAGVPEPANWALMIAGFGLAGAAMRRRRVTVSYA